MAIVEGAKELGVLPQEALSDLVGPRPPPPRHSDPSSDSSDSDEDDAPDELIDEDELDDEDEDEDDDVAPPLPPRRSESLLKSNLYNNGLDSFSKMPDFLQGTDAHNIIDRPYYINEYVVKHFS